MKHKQHKHLITIISAVTALLFTVYIILDTFVISYSYVIVEAASAQETPYAADITGRMYAVGPVPEDLIHEDVTSEDISSEEIIPEDVTIEEITTEEMISGEITPENITSESMEYENADNNSTDKKSVSRTKRQKHNKNSSLPDAAVTEEGTADGMEKAETHEAADDMETAKTYETADDMETAKAYEAAAGETAAKEITGSSYEDENINIRITQYRVDNTTVYAADVQISDAEFLKTAFANNTYGKNVTAATSEIAKDSNAILAVNGDYYGIQENGYVIRQGVLYRDSAKRDQEDLVIYEDGSFEIINESDISAGELLENGAYNVLSFGPGLIIDGEIAVSENEEVDKAKTSNPRTAIGIIDELHYVFITADGRTDESEGLSLYELAEFMMNLGCTQAYNLDGGGSSTMVFYDTVINNPSSGSSKRKTASSGASTGERSVSDIVYIGY